MRPLLWLLAVVGSLLFASRTVQAQAPYRVGEHLDGEPLGKHFTTFEDPTGHFSFEEVRKLSANVTRLEEALKRAEEATRAKSDFLATVSHELRTPLNAIINLPQALGEDVPDLEVACCSQCESMFEPEEGDAVHPDIPCPECGHAGGLRVDRRPQFVGNPEQLRRYLGHIERSGRHLLQMVNGILDISKVEAGKFELSLAPVETSALLRDAVEPLTHLATSRGVRLELAPDSQEGVLQGDALRLTQVLINLIGNAIKFSNHGGCVRVRAEAEEVFCTFSVEDEGIGIAPEDIERIFESFEQVDRGDTRKYGGTGLGLSISKALVELHGGSIWVTSALGEGSTFYFRVPAAVPAHLRTTSGRGPLGRTHQTLAVFPRPPVDGSRR